jgi:hypothetical protein
MPEKNSLKSYTRVVSTNDGQSVFEAADTAGRGHVTRAVGSSPVEALSIPESPIAA